MTKKTKTIAIFDENHIDLIFRRAAYSKALADKIHIKEISGWLADFEEVDMPPPLQTRLTADSLRDRWWKDLRTYAESGQSPQLRTLMSGILENHYRNFDKIKKMHRDVGQHNAKVLKRLMVGQYTVAGIGALAGLGLIAVGSGASLVMIGAGLTGATELTAFGLAMGSTSQVVGATVAANVSVSAARSWSECESWSGIAFGGGSQVLTEAGRYAVGKANDAATAGVSGMFARLLAATPQFDESLRWMNSAMQDGTKLAGAGAGSILTLVFAGQDIRNEFKNLNTSLESPQQRSRRLQQSSSYRKK